jgi:uncharacterized MAPEG superfamily protein
MTPELNYLAWTLALALVQILVAATLRTREVGLPYAASARDFPPPAPPSLLTGRIIRAQNNILETLPIFIAVVLIAHLTNRDSDMTRNGACIYFWARLIYLPVYALGIRYVRTAVWFVSLVGIVMVMTPLFNG